MQSKRERNRIITSLWSARIIPLLLAGVVGYATYVLVVLLSVNYLLKKHRNNAAAIPILVVYFVLFILMTASFIRLSHIITFDPPYVPLGSSAPPARRDRIILKEKGRARGRDGDITRGEYDPREKSRDIRAGPGAQNDPDSPGLELFYTKDAFICEMDGRPRWCSSCANWKPDRARHCSSSGRCIRKMDHFCPWVGGPIGENNFKFFIQFNGYAALYCAHLIVVMAIYIRQQIIQEDEQINPQFAAILGLAGLFWLFTGSMFGTCVDLAMKNLTQVEKLGSKSRAYQLAVLKPSSEDLHRISGGDILRSPILEITYPLELDQSPGAQKSTYFHDTSESDLPGQQSTVALQTYQPHQEVPNGFAEFPSSGPADESSSIPRSAALVHASSAEQSAEHSKALLSAVAENNVVRPTQLDTSLDIQPNSPLQDAGRRTGDTLSNRDNMATRTFGVLTMDTGDNPWDLGSRLLNLETVMGTNFFDYFLPFRRSPCCDHEDHESYYFVGPAVDVVRSKFYFMDAKDMRKRGGRQRHELHLGSDQAVRPG